MPTVSVWVQDGMSAFELGVVTEVFGLPRPELGVEWYTLRTCAERPEPMIAVGGFTIATPYGADDFAAAGTVIVPGVPDVHGPVSPVLVEALRVAHGRGARVVSICSGAFALAAAGLLDGRTATTHWRYAALLAERFPAVRVDPDVLYVDHGDVVTGAGSAAGIDLCLHLVRRDHGARIAAAIARRLVVTPHRDGGQAQYVEVPLPPAPADNPVSRATAWATAHLAEPLTLADLAAAAGRAPRTFGRLFAAQTGTTPIRWLIDQRIAASLPMLEDGDAPVEEVARAVGFDSPVTYRHHFGRAMRTSPSAYRKSFRTRPA